ncbi:type VII secretion protein EccB [Nocardia implantans]|uniref:Type VII secretion protein EccB n=1 Tax=Nocardia implantans TaxID=3108168 RepID=A0ABU6AWN8_9NOCA|nr:MULTISPECIES: type VII secretion protein EccB [unclassified Nocardia]MBF6192926.1 type VII secretion protein EccB [Nocardia beijingensis]MEA3531356.1 type VII secretion protein EccB [Nocardia sp. CDC192]MEB3511703.1 type VII secretion protein EccB [Nocardia sp. CDC186]
MPAQLTTRAQVNGYRFLLRRLDHALVRRDVRMLHDPMRSQIRSLLVGAVLGVLVVAGAAILAFLRPQGAIGDAVIVSGKQSGALYVVVQGQDGGKTLHPVLNLASARLITGADAEPHAVKDDKLNDLPRGPLLGIPGAPSALPGSAQGSKSEWSLCETIALSEGGSAASSSGGTTTVIAGHPALADRIRTANHDEALLVRRDNKTYLVYDGKRAEVDPANSVMARALDLRAQRPRPVGTGLLGATTQVPALTPPQIPRAGERGPGPLSEIPVGGVISVSGVGPDGGSALYVVLADGLQPISPFTAQVIRYADSHGMREIATMPPDVLDRVPVVRQLPVDDFPVRTPRILPAEDAPVACVAWAKSPGAAPGPSEDNAGDGPGERAAVSLLVGTRLPIAESAKPVEVSTSDGVGDRVDAAYIPPGSGEFVQVTGMEPGSPRRDSLFYVADTGVRYGIPDAATANVLGLGGSARLAPWAIIGQLVPGPTLSAREALVSHDSLPTK